MANDDNLTKGENQLLQTIYDCINETLEFPDGPLLAYKLNLSRQRISNIKRTLREKGYLKGKRRNTQLTKKAIQVLKAPPDVPGFRSVSNTYVPLLGEVSAGTGDQFDDLAVYINETDDSSLESIAIPQVDADANVIAMQVKGDSMVDAGILDGDFVIVELEEGLRLMEENQIIIARYLPKYAEEILDEDEDIVDTDSLILVGPTLKVYKGQYFDSDHKPYYRLGRVKDYGKKNPYEIETRILKKVGRVIGVYRPI